MVENIQKSKYSRRDFLQKAVAGAIALPIFTGSHLTLPIIEQYLTGTKANVPNDQFLEENSHKLAHLKIGGSFAPEQVDYLNEETDKERSPLKMLQYIVEDLNIKDLRLGIRWSHVMFQKNKVDLSYYKPYLDYCLKAGVNLCLNVGPIKTFRWPEQHIPFFLKDNNLPPKAAIIIPDMTIAKEATEYLDLLLHSLTTEYGTDLQKQTPIVQVENESGIPYGEYGWTMNDNYLQQVTSVAKQHFPNSKFLFNTGPFVVEPIFNLLNLLNSNGVKTIYGIDYYYSIDDHTNHQNWILQLPFINHLDLVTLSKIFGKPLWPSNTHTSDIEITEGQFEGWGKYQAPGNSIREFRYLLLRCMDDIFNVSTTDSRLIRLWGLEAFAQKILNKRQTKDHNQIVQLIHAVNDHYL